MNRKYKGVYWTNHALERLQDRNIKQADAWAAFNRPDSSKFSSKKGVWTYKRTWGKTSLGVVAKKNDKGEWLILSVWSRTKTTSSTDIGLLAKLKNALGF